MKALLIPEAGQRVHVKRWHVPCPELEGCGPRRELVVDLTGVVQQVDDGTGHRPERPPVIYLDITTMVVTLDTIGEPGQEADNWMICLGCQFLGQDPDRGYSWTLQTEVELLEAQEEAST